MTSVRGCGALLRTVRANVSGSQIRGRFVLSVTTAPRRPGRAVFGATSDRDDIRGSTRGSQIRGGRFTSVTSASALLSRKFGVVHICDLRVGGPLPKVRRTWLGHGFSAPRGEERPRDFSWIEKVDRKGSTYVRSRPVKERNGELQCVRTLVHDQARPATRPTHLADRLRQPCPPRFSATPFAGSPRTVHYQRVRP